MTLLAKLGKVGTRAPTGVALLGAALVLIAFNLRTPVTSVGPVLPEASHATGLSGTGASMLTMLPALCFGLFSPLAPRLSRFLGIERAILAALAALVMGTALRGTGETISLFAGQILACGGIGMINVLLPSLVKRDFPHRIALVTGLYVMSMSVGAALAAGATVPLDRLFGSWEAALGVWAVPALIATLAWLPRLAAPSEPTDARNPRLLGLWSDRLAWQVTLFMGLQSALAYIVFGWLAPILRDRGLSPVDAGLALSISIVAQAVASLVAPSLATLGKDQRPAVAALSLLCVASLLGCLYAPLGSCLGLLGAAWIQPGRAFPDRLDADCAAGAGCASDPASLRHGTGRRLHFGLCRPAAGGHPARIDGQLDGTCGPGRRHRRGNAARGSRCGTGTTHKGELPTVKVIPPPLASQTFAEIAR